MVTKLLKAIEALRSQVAKNAMLTITDSFVLLGEGSIQDREVSEAYQKLIRKVGETNQFLALEAK